MLNICLVALLLFGLYFALRWLALARCPNCGNRQTVQLRHLEDHPRRPNNKWYLCSACARTFYVPVFTRTGRLV